MEQDQEYTCTEPLGILPEIFSAIGMLSAIIRIFRKTGTNCSRFRLHISVLFDRLKFHVRFSLAAIQDFDSRRSTSLSVRTNTLACACIYSGVQDASENGWFRCYQNRDWDGNFLFKASIGRSCSCSLIYYIINRFNYTVLSHISKYSRYLLNWLYL